MPTGAAGTNMDAQIAASTNCGVLLAGVPKMRVYTIYYSEGLQYMRTPDFWKLPD